MGRAAITAWLVLVPRQVTLLELRKPSHPDARATITES